MIAEPHCTLYDITKCYNGLKPQDTIYLYAYRRDYIYAFIKAAPHFVLNPRYAPNAHTILMHMGC
jgi:hypothetical protein